jgi:hypothetical protein
MPGGRDCNKGCRAVTFSLTSTRRSAYSRQCVPAGVRTRRRTGHHQPAAPEGRPLAARREGRRLAEVVPRDLPAPTRYQFCAQSPTLPAPIAELGSSSTILHTFLMREEIGARELHLMEEAVCIEKERIAAPTREESVIASARYKCFLPD